MQLNALRPRQALNKAYLRLKTSRSDMEAFKGALRTLLDNLNLNESEEHAKNHLRDFLLTSFYSGYALNTKGKTDLVIHTGPSTKSPAGVLLEVKRPTNRADMPTTSNLNYKALHELLLYYLRERLEHKNGDLRQLIVTNVHEWFIFDALEFDRVFFRSGQLKKDFTDWAAGRKTGSSTDFFYKEIAAPFIAGLDETIQFTHFNLKDWEKPLRNKDLADDVKLVALYKVLSPVQLLKEPFANDANSLDRRFYGELLHIIGLEEVKEGGRKLIRRREKPDAGSLLEAAYQKLRSEDLVSGLDNPQQWGSTREEQLFSVSLELCITWINRVLFLKLLEAQLISYHGGDGRFAFMSTDNLREFDDLNELFFDVLAEQPGKRVPAVREKYSHIPYLNSSLFETTPLEKRTLRISNLNDSSQLPVYSQSVLRDAQGKPLRGKAVELPTLQYLMRFLASYDFGAEGKEEIQEENKTLITASVLGLIFEKINGYRDGSFYTPGFITMYMSREAIRRAVVQRFNEAYGWAAQNFEELQFLHSAGYSMQRVQQSTALINELRICDPAVGSGHYLVSALNELIVIKAELRLLVNSAGKPLNYGSIEVQNEELIVTDHLGELFSYQVHVHPDGHRSINPMVQELQQALFHEKQNIIEGCLFGVDINPNSVKICRLRLWIELLKNAYYMGAAPQSEGYSSQPYAELQTLPNIDINIKQGNSLLSRYPLTADLADAFGRKGHSLQAYREAVANYKHTNSKDDKKQLEQSLKEIKEGFKTTLHTNDPLRKKMSDLRGQIQVMQNPDLFGAKKVDKKLLQQKQKALNLLEAERASIEANKVYEGAFEWRFEFPEVLDEQGNYRGFDVVLGNPPYIPLENFTERERAEFRLKYEQLERKYDTSVLFILEGLNLMKPEGILSFIAPQTWQTGENYAKFRQFILKNKGVGKIINLPFNIFEDAYVDTSVYELYNSINHEYGIYNYDKKDKIKGLDKIRLNYITIDNIVKPDYKIILDENATNLGLKFVGNKFITLGEITKSTQGLSGSNFEKTDIEENTEENYPFLSKGNVYNYSLIKEEIYYTSLSEKKSLKQFYNAEDKLLIRRIINRQNRLSVGYCNEKLVFKKDINPFIVIDTRFNVKYLLGILASKLLSYLYLNTSSIATKNDFRQTTLSELRKLPIPLVDLDKQYPIAELTDNIISLKKKDSSIDTSVLEAKIDLLVYLLYKLSYEEVLLVDPAFGISKEEFEVYLNSVVL